MISVIIPTFNEASNIQDIIDEIDEVLTAEHEIIIVDDNSPDGTAELARQKKEDVESLKVVKRESREGIGSAYKYGFEIAEGDVIVQSDADFSHPPKYIPDLVEVVNSGKDIAVGSRYVEKGTRNDPLHRRINPLIGSYIYRYVLGCPVSDFTSGFKAYTREAAREILGRKDELPDGFHFQAASLMMLLENGYTAEEVPIDFMPRRSGEPKYSFRDFFDNVKLLFELGMDRYHRVLKFATVGAVGSFIDMGILFTLTEVFGFHYMVSAVVSKETATLTNFGMNELWTFLDRGREGVAHLFKRAVKFNAVSLVGVGLNLGLLYGFTEILGIYYLVSNLLAILIVFGWNYWLNSRWTWKK